MIKFEHISKRFGSLEVLKDVTQQVTQNEIVSLIGLKKILQWHL